jgi:hypothetical protein
MRQTVFHAWSRKEFEIKVTDFRGEPGTAMLDGIALGDVPLGMHFRDYHAIDVSHLVSGRRIGSFKTLGAAMEFVHAVAYETDWRHESPVINARLYALISEATQ